MKSFKSVLEFQKDFNTEEKCRKYLEEQRWNGTIACPFCGSTHVMRFTNDKKIFKCKEKDCRKKFSVTVGTIYENTKLPLTKWFLAIYLLTVHSKGISSLQLAKFLGITQRSAWFLNHRIRQMLTVKSPELLTGIVETDETFIGGSESNKHFNKRNPKGVSVKSIVWGAVSRDGKVRTVVIPRVHINTITTTVRGNVELHSTVVSDEHHAYNMLHEMYDHRVITHNKRVYVRKEEDISVHTNRIEGFWAILKRQINGTHHFVSPKHLQRYCNEISYRYNCIKMMQDERFVAALSNCEGKLLYRILIARNGE